jgi:hypothetical protein
LAHCAALGFSFWLFDSFAVDIVSFEVIADIGFVDIPQCFFDALALLGDQFFRLMREILNALPNPSAALKPTGIAVSIIIIARFPASLTVGLAARLCPSPEPAISLMSRVDEGHDTREINLQGLPTKWPEQKIRN